LLDLIATEPALATWGAVRLQITHVRPAADRAERDAESARGLRGGQAERTCGDFIHVSISASLGGLTSLVEHLHNLVRRRSHYAGAIWTLGWTLDAEGDGTMLWMKLRLYHHHDGARVAYRETGTGPALALLHSLWLSHREWEPVVASLSEPFRVVLPDLP